MIEIAGATTELAPLPDEAPRPPLDAAWWTSLAVLRAEWSTLAVVAADGGAPAAAVASGLADLARSYRLPAVRALDASGPAAPELAQLQAEIAAPRAGEARLAIAVDHPRAQPSYVPLLAQVDAAVIVVHLGTATMEAIEEVVALVGRERVLGCIVAR